MTSTPKKQMDLLHEQLQSDPDRTAGIEAIFAFDVSGPDGGTWWIEAANGIGAVHEGASERPTVTVHLTDDVFVRLATKELDGAEAYFGGLLTVDGDQSKAVFLGKIFGD